jgi:hypothetical protein
MKLNEKAVFPEENGFSGFGFLHGPGEFSSLLKVNSL